jgi:glycerophosphodiester phosphodiesterase
MTCRATKCAGYLTPKILSNPSVAEFHSCLNHLVISTGRSGELDPKSELQSGSNPSVTETGTNIFVQMLQQLGTHHAAHLTEILQTADTFGRYVLHYSARYGLTEICRSILNSLKASGLGSSASYTISSTDLEGQTPFRYAVIHNHKAVIKLFIETLMEHNGGFEEGPDEATRKMLSDAFLVALRYQHDDIFHLLASPAIDMNHRSSRDETLLHAAARIGREDYFTALLNLGPSKSIINLPESSRGWTPLHIASSEGHTAVVRLLVQAGADQTIVDHLGWTAKEKAAFRGHLTIARSLDMCKIGDPTCGPADSGYKDGGVARTLRTGETIIIVNLGAMNERRQVPAIDLSYRSPEERPDILDFAMKLLDNPYSDTELILEIYGSPTPALVQLPLLRDNINQPFIFRVDDSNGVQLQFSIFRAHRILGHKDDLVGSGMVLLQDQNRCLGEERESLIREQVVPILNTGLGYLGKVTFTYVIAKPCRHKHTPSPPDNNPLKSDEVQLFGHRGIYSLDLGAKLC